MKKFLATALVLVLALTVCFSFAACDKLKNVYAIAEQIDYLNVFTDYLEYPDAANEASMAAVERNVSDIYNDSSLTDAQKAAQMMDKITHNEMATDHVSFFIDRSGETKMNKNHGQLIYQRLRRQSNTVKDDTTLKLPVNHNFDLIAQNTLTDATIRYVTGGKLYKISGSEMGYDESTGLITVGKWKRGNKWNHKEDIDRTPSDPKWYQEQYEDIRKSCINWNVENIVDGSTVSISLKTDFKGNEYYELKFSVNIAAANADKTTIDRLENDNGGSGMKYEYCDFVVEIWKNGLAKKYSISESWSGKIVAYSGSAQCKSTIIYSYSENDMKDTKTAEIKSKIK